MYGLNIRDDFILLHDFYMVVKAGTLSKLAEKTYISLSSLSKNITNLEEKTKCKLLNRTNKGITLTNDGEMLFKQLDFVFQNIDGLSNSEKKESITIGTTRNIADNKLSKYLSSFNKICPNTNISIITDSASNLNKYLNEHKLDVLIDYLPHINYSTASDFEIKSVGSFETCFACSEEFYEKIKKDLKTLKDLNKYNLVIPGSSRRRQILDEVLQRNNAHLTPLFEMPDSRLMSDLVKTNDFIGYFIKDEIQYTGLKIIELEEEMPLNQIGIIYPKDTLNESAKKFIELVLNMN